MENYWIYLLWAIVVITTLIDINKIPRNVKALKDGWKGLAFLPVAVVILYSMLYVALKLAEIFPVLNWGWLGTNIVAAPLIDVATASETTGMNLISFLTIIGFAITIVFLCLIANYYEEEGFRSTYKSVVIWALLHLIMGIPIYALIPIFCLGIFYKFVHDKYSLNHAYTLHFSTNVTVVALVVAVVLLGI